MTDEILFARQGRIGLVTLNRPQALNALTRTMCVALHRQLMAWAIDDDVQAARNVSVNQAEWTCRCGDILRV